MRPGECMCEPAFGGGRDPGFYQSLQSAFDSKGIKKHSVIKRFDSV